MTFTIVGFEGKRGGVVAYIKSVNYEDGPGLKVKRMQLTADRTQAARFRGPDVAAEIAVQFYTRFPVLEAATGAPLQEATQALRDDCARRRAAAVQVRDDFEAALREALSPVLGVLQGGSEKSFG